MMGVVNLLEMVVGTLDCELLVVLLVLIECVLLMMLMVCLTLYRSTVGGQQEDSTTLVLGDKHECDVSVYPTLMMRGS